VIIGHLIPAGTGALKYRSMNDVVVEEDESFVQVSEEGTESVGLPPINA